MSTHRAEFPATTMYNVLIVSISECDAWPGHEPSARDRKDRELTTVIK